MKRTTINGLQWYADEHNKDNEGANYDWFDILMEWYINGNISQVKEDIESMSKFDTLKVIERCVDNVNCSQYEDRDLMRVYYCALNSLKDKLLKMRKRKI